MPSYIALADAAGVRAYTRGESYVAAGRVDAPIVLDGVMTATVRGTYSYRTTLRLDTDEVVATCTCPVGGQGAVCKHAVALGLVALGAPLSAEVDDMEDVRAHLSGLPKEALVELLLGESTRSESLHRRLRLDAARRAPGELSTMEYRQALDGALRRRGFVEYHEAAAFAHGIDEVVDEIEGLLGDGQAAQVIELCEYALSGVEAALSETDDSDGYLGGVLSRLQDLHLAACTASPPDPEDLARRLFEWEVRADWDTFFGAAHTYADVLGARGLTVYRQLAERAWSDVPFLGPGEKDAERYGTRFRITHVMESIARASGDVDALVEVMKRDLSFALSFLRIAEALAEAGRRDDALEWAERATRSFDAPVDGRVRAFVADEYQRRGRHDEAMAIAWELFEERPELSRFQDLRVRAEKAGAWAEWRTKALGLLRGQIDAAKRNAALSRWARSVDHSELVRILVWEGEVDAAWREAIEGGCGAGLWSELARLREPVAPEDSIFALCNTVEPTIGGKTKHAYRAAVAVLRKIHALHHRVGRVADFAVYLADVRATHKRKRNFIGLLDRESWA